MQKTQNGQPLYRLLGKKTGESKGDKPGTIIKHVTTTREPLTLNHRVELVELYKKKGLAECQNYVNWVMAMSEQDKAKQELTKQALQAIKEKESAQEPIVQKEAEIPEINTP